jgi:hypothetical protein
MKKTLQKINSLVNIGIIREYAIAGGMAHFYYIEPSVTYDLDLIIHMPDESELNPLHKIYEWSRENNYETDGEHIIIEGMAVQFLLAYNDLVKEALTNRSEIIIFDENTFILKPEYLMAIMLQTGRAIDKERFIRFLNEADYDENLFLRIAEKYRMIKEYEKVKNL